MPVRILIPTPLRSFTNNNKELLLEGPTVKDLMSRLCIEYPELSKHLFSENGQLRNFINIYVNDKDIRSLNSVDTEVESKDTVSIIPAIAGGLST